MDWEQRHELAHPFIQAAIAAGKSGEVGLDLRFLGRCLPRQPLGDNKPHLAAAARRGYLLPGTALRAGCTCLSDIFTRSKLDKVAVLHVIIMLRHFATVAHLLMLIAGILMITKAPARQDLAFFCRFLACTQQ